MSHHEDYGEPVQGPPPQGSSHPDAGKKIAAGVLALTLGGFGVHKFILGYTSAGLIMLLVSLLTCGIGAMIMWPIAIIEGIVYLTKSDEEFVNTYVLSRREWF